MIITHSMDQQAIHVQGASWCTSEFKKTKELQLIHIIHTSL